MPSYAVMSNMVKEEMKRKVKKQLALLCKDENLELTEHADTIEKLNYITKRKPSRFTLEALCEGSEGEGGEEKLPKDRVRRLNNFHRASEKIQWAARTLRRRKRRRERRCLSDNHGRSAS